MRTASVKVALKEKIQFLNALQQAGLQLDEAFSQHDRIFKSENKNIKLIIRTDMKPNSEPVYYIVYREYCANGTTLNYVAKVIDYEQIVRIVHGLGYKLIAEVNKERQMVQITDMIALSFDKVKDLGEYIKLERAVNKDDDLNWIRADLAEALKTLGINENAKLIGSYSELLAKK